MNLPTRIKHAFAGILGLLALLTAHAGPSARKLRFDHLSVTDGLSQMSVVSVVQDADGYLWFGTRDGLNRYDGYDFRIFRHELHDTTSISDSYIRCMANDRDGRLWVGTTNGLNRYDPRTERFTRYYIDRERHTGNINEINAICADPAGGVWLGTYEGLYHLGRDEAQAHRFEEVTQRIYSLASDGKQLYIGHDRGLAVLSPDGTLRHVIRDDRSRAVNLVYPDSQGRVHFSFANTGTLGLLNPETGELSEHTIIAGDPHRRNNLIRSIAEQPDGKLVLGTYDGLRIYDPQRGRETESYNQTPQEGGGLSHYAVETVYVDRAGTLWAGTYAGGVNYAHAQNALFNYYDPRRGDHLPGVLSAIVAEPSGDVLWIGSDAGGILRFDVRSGEFAYYPCTTVPGEMFKDNNVKSLLLDGKTLYVGLYTGLLYTFDTAACRWTGMWRNPDHSAIYSLARTRDTLLLGTYSAHGLKYLAPGGIEDRDLMSDDGRTVNINQISALCPSDDGLWIGTRSRGLYRYRPSGELTRYTSDDGNSISGNRITAIFADSRKRILIGTSDGGLNVFDPETERFTIVTHNEGLHDNTVCSAVEDRKGRLWVITRTGISELDASNRVLRTYDHSGGIRVQEFSPASAFVTDDNTVWVGGDSGLVSFNPDNLHVNTYAPPVVITSVAVNNRPLGGGFGLSTGRTQLRLKHDENNLTFAFSALNYIYPERNAYSYKLEGADNEWRSVGSVREVNYANLAPGNYLFRVRGSNNDGIWNESDTTLGIEIAPPVWLRWWAITFYLLLLATVGWLIFRYARERRRLRQHVMLKQKHEELYKARIELFTNFAHELRTPLTLILSPLEEMLTPDNPQEATHESLMMMYANAKRMMLLINQLMDLRRKEAGSMTPKVAEGDFAGFAEEIFIAFNHQARNHRIDYRFETSERPLTLWYDRWLFEKVLLNLLSNAFKFTPRRRQHRPAGRNRDPRGASGKGAVRCRALSRCRTLPPPHARGQRRRHGHPGPGTHFRPFLPGAEPRHKERRHGHRTLAGQRHRGDAPRRDLRRIREGPRQYVPRDRPLRQRPFPRRGDHLRLPRQRNARTLYGQHRCGRNSGNPGTPGGPERSHGPRRGGQPPAAHLHPPPAVALLEGHRSRQRQVGSAAGVGKDAGTDHQRHHDARDGRPSNVLQPQTRSPHGPHSRRPAHGAPVRAPNERGARIRRRRLHHQAVPHAGADPQSTEHHRLTRKAQRPLRPTALARKPGRGDQRRRRQIPATAERSHRPRHSRSGAESRHPLPPDRSEPRQPLPQADVRHGALARPLHPVRAAEPRGTHAARNADERLGNRHGFGIQQPDPFLGLVPQAVRRTALALRRRTGGHQAGSRSRQGE